MKENARDYVTLSVIGALIVCAIVAMPAWRRVHEAETRSAAVAAQPIPFNYTALDCYLGQLSSSVTVHAWNVIPSAWRATASWQEPNQVTPSLYAVAALARVEPQLLVFMGPDHVVHVVSQPYTLQLEAAKLDPEKPQP